MFHLDAVFLVLKEHPQIYQPSAHSIRQPLEAAPGRGVVQFRTDMWKSNQTLNYMAGFLCLHLFKVLTEPQWNNRAVCKSPWKNLIHHQVCRNRANSWRVAVTKGDDRQCFDIFRDPAANKVLLFLFPSHLSGLKHLEFRFLLKTDRNKVGYSEGKNCGC